MKTQEALEWIAGVFEEPKGRVTADTERSDILGWDSLGTLTLIAALDEQFDVHLAQADIDSMKGVRDVLDLLRRNGKLEEG